jgi:hypothetical protein
VNMSITLAAMVACFFLTAPRFVQDLRWWPGVVVQQTVFECGTVRITVPLTGIGFMVRHHGQASE